MTILFVIALPFVGFLTASGLRRVIARTEPPSSRLWLLAIAVGACPYLALLGIAILSIVLTHDPADCGSWICGGDPKTCTLYYKVSCEASFSAVILIPVLIVGAIGSAISAYKISRKVVL